MRELLTSLSSLLNVSSDLVCSSNGIHSQNIQNEQRRRYRTIPRLYNSHLPIVSKTLACGLDISHLVSTLPCHLFCAAHTHTNQQIRSRRKAIRAASALGCLSLAGALPDVTFFLLQFLGIETSSFDAAIAKRGCFPYSNDYPYSHFLAGMIGFGTWFPFS